MANVWLAKRCDDESQTIIIDLSKLGVTGLTSGSTVSYSDNITKYCVSLVEPTLLDKQVAAQGSYASCIECFNKVGVTIGFTSCFGERNFNMSSSGIKIVPQIGNVYKIDLTILPTFKGEPEINITDCFTYVGNTDRISESVRINSDVVEFVSCAECNPYKSKRVDWENNVAEKAAGAKESYSRIFPA